MTNQNVSWINDRGTWPFYIFMLGFSRYTCFVWGLPTDVSWSFVLISHAVITYWLIHMKRGSLLTWEDKNGKYDKMTYWEQIDGGRHYSSNRKFLMIVPMILLLICYHQTSGLLFFANLSFTILILIPKLPIFSMNSRKTHRRSASNNAFVLGFRSFGSASCFPDGGGADFLDR